MLQKNDDGKQLRVAQLSSSTCRFRGGTNEHIH